MGYGEIVLCEQPLFLPSQHDESNMLARGDGACPSQYYDGPKANSTSFFQPLYAF